MIYGGVENVMEQTNVDGSFRRRPMACALVAALTLLSCEMSKGAARPVSPAMDLSAGLIAASTTGHRVARVVSASEATGAGIEILSGEAHPKVIFVAMRSIIKGVGRGVASVSALEFSTDGEFLAVEVSDQDVRSVVTVIDTRVDFPVAQALLLGSEKASSSPHWATSGHVLFVKPVSVDLGDPKDNGIVRYNADDGSTSKLLEGFFVVGKDYSVTSESVVAIVHQEHDKARPHEAIVRQRFGTSDVQTLRSDK